MNIFSLSHVVELAAQLPAPTLTGDAEAGYTMVIRLPVPKWDPIRDAAHPGRQFDVHDNDYVEFEVLPWTDSRGVISARWVLRGVVAV